MILDFNFIHQFNEFKGSSKWASRFIFSIFPNQLVLFFNCGYKKGMTISKMLCLKRKDSHYLSICLMKSYFIKQLCNFFNTYSLDT